MFCSSLARHVFEGFLVPDPDETRVTRVTLNLRPAPLMPGAVVIELHGSG